MRTVMNSRILAEVDGSKGNTYNIVRGKDGVVYCTCWAWKMNKTCKHLDEFFSRYNGSVSPSPAPVPTLPSKPVINNADDLISSLDPKFWEV